VVLIRPYLRYGTVKETAKWRRKTKETKGESQRAETVCCLQGSAASTSCGVARARRTPPPSELRTVVLRTLPGALRTRVGPRSATQKLACLFVVLATSSAN